MAGLGPKLARWIPFLKTLAAYDRRWLPNDLAAGLSAAAVQIPTAVAYAQLTGLPPVTGLYACVLPLVAYVFFGSCRQLMVGPDSATCAMLAATLAPLASSGDPHYAELSVAVAIVAAIACFIGRFMRVGFIADFLSEPILTGFLNGVALNIMLGQLNRIFGLKLQSSKFWPMLWETLNKISHLHLPTTILGLSLVAFLLLSKKVAPRVPGILFAVIAAAGAAFLFRFEAKGIAILGTLPAGFAPPLMPNLKPTEWEMIIPGALGILLVSYCNLILAGRTFAKQGHYDADANQDLLALGIADLATAFSRGFMVSSSTSQTAVAISVGGKTQLANLVAACVIAAVLVFGTVPLGFIPQAALGAVLVVSAVRLLDFASLRRYYSISRTEFWLSVVTTFGVLSFGILQGIVLAVLLALLHLLSQISRPNDAVLGKVPGLDGYNDISKHPDATTIPGLLICRYDAPILFFNADYFKARIYRLLGESKEQIRCVLLDLETTAIIDITGGDALDEVRCHLVQRGIDLKICRARRRALAILERIGLIAEIGESNLFPSIRSGVEAFLHTERKEDKR
jgi:high affinity sulfate transporter 1